MPANDGADGSQKLKPKVSKTNLKAAGGTSGKSPSVSGKAPVPKKSADSKSSGIAKKPGAVSGLKPKVSGKTPKVSDKSAKVSEKLAKPDVGTASGSSTVLKVKKKKSSATGKALHPKKSSLRKSSPVDAKPIQPTEDLEPVDSDLELAEPEGIEDTTVAYTEPPEDSDRDGVTETFVLDTSKEEDAEGDEAADEDAGDDAKEDDDKADDESAENGDDDDLNPAEADAEGEAESAKEKSAKKDGDKAAGKSKFSNRKGRASKRGGAETEGGEGDSKGSDRASKRSAALKKADRSKVKLFLFFAIGSLVGLILIPVVMWWKGMWPFDGNRPKEEALVYAVPAYQGETFATLVQEFTVEANPQSLLEEKNPSLAIDKPFDKKVMVTVGIPKQWSFRPTGDNSFVQHFLAETEKAVEADTPDIGKANQNLLMAKKMLERFVLKSDLNDATKKQWQDDYNKVEDKVTRASGGTPPNRNTGSGGTSAGGNNTNGGSNNTNSNTPPPPPPPTQAEQTAKAREISKPVYENLAKVRGLLTDNKPEALALIKTILKQMDQLHDYHELQGIPALDKLLDKEFDLQTLDQKGDAITVEDWDKLGAPTEMP